ncbi:MAG: hypothetical protein Q4F38_08545 [Akkermansia sp.]|nr:hypothetical protein [Akkermansia sp.]
MKSLILTILYLAKDTVHRWFARISSPLARVLVVFFLSLSALSALGSYAISAKLVKNKIIRQGGDLVSATMTHNPDIPSAFPTEKQVADLLNADSYALSIIGFARTEERRTLTVYTYDFCRSGQMQQILGATNVPIVLASEESDFTPGPTSLTINNIRLDAQVRHMPPEHPIMRLVGDAAVIISVDNLPPALTPKTATLSTILRVRNLESSADITRLEQYLRTFMRLEGRHGGVISASRLLSEMDDALSKQMQCRAAFCLGISGIVGILLTALAGMEYRQNEYIYTLMKSFGIRPLLLVGAFIVENLIIVGASFAAALAAFMHFQRPIVTQILRLGNYSLTLQEILPEIQLICYTLLGCILVSSLPIIAAANRDIGRVLK